ncbi:MAG TPA: PTS mannose transporter subunit IID [Ruminococcaceae bacterium]|jgi:dihydroxyacetone kinase phosphotransfer subunit|nr:PTS mannose transporter subunit IID [Oscillospiraceae bacterium]HBT90443.1 PTS mannose transporter subunit IID [Oscillospiraceae bacterium]HCB91350.1 PTS mannose transporter subunit IID [Oscillospiraceae bacterium]
MVGLVIASHSAKLAEGVKELAAQMAGDDLKIIPAGGLADGTIGTDAVRIGQAIQKADSGDGVVVLADLGSAVLSTQTALELLDEKQKGRIRIADAPLVEGAVGAAVTASAGSPLNEVVGEAEKARDLKKL